MHDLTALGWDDVFAEEFEPHAQAGLIPGRVAVQPARRPGGILGNV